MQLRYPRPLPRNGRIGVTAPSSGIGAKHRARFDFAVEWLTDRGLRVEIGGCLDGSTHVSASAAARADELMRMLLDPDLDAVLPPWGGETAIDLLPLLDFDALRNAEPTWFIGFSDISTLLTPITLLAGWATLHGGSLMDSPYEVPAPALSWLDVAGAATGAPLRQGPPGVHLANAWEDWSENPRVTRHAWNGSGGWRRLDGGAGGVSARGRLIGGCIETVSNLAGTRYGDPAPLRGTDGTEPLIVYLEAAENGAFDICRNLHGMRLAGFFTNARAILIGRTTAPDAPTLTQDEAVLDALGGLGVPILADVDFGHVPPQMAIVNGAPGHVVHDADTSYLDQTLTG